MIDYSRRNIVRIIENPMLLSKLIKAANIIYFTTTMKFSSEDYKPNNNNCLRVYSITS